MKKAIVILFLALLLSACEAANDITSGVADLISQAESALQSDDNKLGTRKNPAPLNTTVTYDGINTLFDRYKAEITFTEVIRGADAWNMVKSGNEFNDVAPEGKEYLIIKVRVKALESVNDEKIDINNASFELVSKDGVKYDDFAFVSGVEPQLKEMYAGAEQEGYIVFTVKTDDEPTVVFLDRNNGGIWFSLK
jgi:PBP1b-binding outer membrane lipoprotein LpoB